MSARGLLLELLDLIRHQTEAIMAGDAQAVLDGAARYELSLGALETAPMDLAPPELRALRAQIDREKAKLNSVLTSESVRVDFLLRLILGGANAKASLGYPGSGLRPEANARVLNHRA